MSSKIPFSIMPTVKEADKERMFLLPSDKEGKKGNFCYIFKSLWFWIWTIGLSLAFVIAMYELNPSRDSDMFPIKLMNSGDRIHLRSSHSDLFVRVNDKTGQLVLDQSIAWKRGSTFEVEASGECFILRSLTGKYVRIDSLGNIHSSSDHRYGATHFTAVSMKEKSSSIPSSITPLFSTKAYMSVHLKVCKTNIWVREVVQSKTDTSKDGDLDDDAQISDIETTPSPRNLNTNSDRVDYDIGKSGNITEMKPRNGKSPQYMLIASPLDTRGLQWGEPTIARKDAHATRALKSLRRLVGYDDYGSSSGGGSGGWGGYGGGGGNNTNGTFGGGGGGEDPTMGAVSPLLSAFDVIAVDQLRGVNLGGWFIPEVWMASAFFNGTGLGWGGSLCTIVNYSRSLAESRISERLATWITEEDIMEIKSMGFNSVRLPIGYWNVMSDPYKLFAPSDHRISLKYIDWCFDICAKHGLTVLLDLHGAPGSQNGIDHSGCSMRPQWIREDNVQMTLTAIEAMAKRYGNRPNLVGFELLNEPSQYYSENNHTALLDFYEKSYAIIRGYSTEALVVFNELYTNQYSWWNQALLEPDFYNVVVDWHLYQFQYPHFTTYEHVAAARAWENTIAEFDSVHPIIIGLLCL